ncbi:RRM domain-containing protein [Aphelenchoides besseyi]|nr:RRM domain-containing protein [Aphelenchoides besseyi]KAI6226780.1 RRM domain-containing protein [Aphelenchoides besseyi]
MTGRYNGGPRRFRVNEKDVPRSRHSIFIRGFKADVDVDDVKEHFVKNVGPCIVDFHKINGDMKFLALRFDSRRDAKKCMETFHEQKVMGYKVELNWYRDVRRFVRHYQRMGLDPPRTNRNHRDPRNRSRSPHRSSRSAERRSADRSSSFSRGRSSSESPRQHSLSPANSQRSRQSHRSGSLPKGPRTPPEPKPISDMEQSDDEDLVVRNCSIEQPTIPHKIRVNINTDRLTNGVETDDQAPVVNGHNSSANTTEIQQQSEEPSKKPVVVNTPPQQTINTMNATTDISFFGQYLISVLERLPPEKRLKLQIEFQRAIYETLYEAKEK